MVRSGQPLISRPEWYDRNPINRTIRYEGLGVAPHAATQRIQYTCPANKKAWLAFIQAHCERVTAAGTVGAVAAYMAYTPQGGSAAHLVYSGFTDNTVGKLDVDDNPVGLIMFTADQVSGTTFDVSTGGTCNYSLGAIVVEFDA